MPMPPMPTKWIVPISVPIAFMPARPSRNWRLAGAVVGRPDLERRRAARDPLDQVGKVARRMRPPDRQRALGGIGQRLRVAGDRLDLRRQRRRA